ncbi:hypothetical protein H5410_014283 [Solanum commersonii]|uniref:Uncharacterized protein n=1 Tax=Solanum commersonii TaxID=4109 RepID=A0A9J5ZQS5_SOLCO|nr:hypothetical protein H5410_014283 [Solanum commersonii]
MYGEGGRTHGVGITILRKCEKVLREKDVARFTQITRTLQTRLHRPPRTLKLCDLIPSLSRPEPTPWAGPALKDHCWPPSKPLAWLS